MRFFIITVRALIVVMSGLLSFGFPQLKAADWFAIADLRGSWSFTVGDDPKWADPNVETTDWDLLTVPGEWEGKYPDYNGYAWYRRTFSLNMIPPRANVVLFLGYIDDVDEVFINGQKVGQSGSFFPEFVTAYNVERRYVVPVSILKRTGNVIAVRVYDDYRYGGIVSAGNFGLYYDRELDLLSIDLSGSWKFSTKREGNMHALNLPDDNWQELFVPMAWESQGYPDYNGVAFYRKRFMAPASLQGKELYLVMGKIDDFDQVYLNGELVGRTETLEQYSRSSRRNRAYSLMRIYKIPAGLLRNKNLVSVEVNDTYGLGGIYEGPVGIVTRDAAAKIGEKYRENNFSNWNFSIWDLIDLFN
ncbi:MAG: beta galactosidase jelly roll domain-containing protein [Mangrovibacterium sp.]